MDSCVLSARKIRLWPHQIRRAVNGRNKPQHVLLNHKTQHHCKESDNEKLMFLEKEAEQKKRQLVKVQVQENIVGHHSHQFSICFLYQHDEKIQVAQLPWSCSLSLFIESMHWNMACVWYAWMPECLPNMFNITLHACHFQDDPICTKRVRFCLQQFELQNNPRKSHSQFPSGLVVQSCHFFDPILHSPKASHFSPTGTTVNGGNPTPLDMVNISLFTWFHTRDRWCRISSLQRRITS